ncbi:hypothetical protein PR202_ga27352 [Eleusine coracana subsp. coracana]|uniref:Uncharacterized protein n=1 Tax=Eleusine coracana subsp. coracana TaxID=191504 RepID=A0AAV5DGL1_ELECO|nr:hypothetical protein PR202_ga27352 [Eleusine coracana subsp. coracana]
MPGKESTPSSSWLLGFFGNTTTGVSLMLCVLAATSYSGRSRKKPDCGQSPEPGGFGNSSSVLSTE